MLTEWLSSHKLADYPLQGTALPPATDRAAWETLRPALRRTYIERAESCLGQPWPALTATQFMAFHRTGNRIPWETPHFIRRNQLSALVIGECIEGKGRFLDDIIDGVWAFCEESYWGVSAHSHFGEPNLPDATRPYIDLFAAETGAQLALTRYLLADVFEREVPELLERIDYELDRRIKQPFMAHRDYWWMGYEHYHINNWNIWISSNVLTVFLLNEPNDAARRRGVDKLLEVADFYVKSLPEDGGCDEGPSYWNVAGAALYDFLEQLYDASAGQISFFGEPLIANVGRYIASVHAANGAFVNFADGGIRPAVSPALIYRFGRQVQDDFLCDLGTYLYHTDSPDTINGQRTTSLRRQLRSLFDDAELSAKTQPMRAAQDAYFPNLQVVTARQSEHPEQGLFFAAKGGHNDESHNHNDVGSFLLYAGGKPALIDPGVGVYTKRTFSRERYDIWTMQSSWHNLPDINGQRQLPGRKFCAKDLSYDATPDRVHVSLELAQAWGSDAHLERFYRDFTFDRQAGRITLKEDYAFLADSNTVEPHFLFAAEPTVLQNTLQARVAGGILRLTFDPCFEAKIERQDVGSDGNLRDSWGEAIWRVTLSAKAGKTASYLYTISYEEEA